jgi:PAS domain S-box-containing protein
MTEPEASSKTSQEQLLRDQKEVVDQLNRSRALLRKAFGSQAGGMLFFDLDGRIREANATFERMSGYSRDELLNEVTLDRLTPPEFREMTARTMRKLSAEGEVQPYQKQLIRKDGSRWWGVFAPTWIGSDGETSDCVEFVIDISDAKRAEAALSDSRAEAERRRQLLDLTLSHIDALIFVVDRERRYVYANRAMIELRGFDPEGYVGERLGEADYPVALKQRFVRQMDAVFDTGAVVADELPYTGASGKARYYRYILTPVVDADGEVEQLAAVAYDITRRKQLESDLKAANRAKDEFLAMLGHELRNPLQPIMTTLQLMQARQPSALADERAIIASQARHLADLVDDLLDVSRIARGKIELRKTPLDMGDLVFRAIETARPMLDEHRQTVETAMEDGLAVAGDRRRVIQIITNLLTNAAKYSPPGRTIQVSAGAERGEVVVRVRDQGIGIDPALLPRIFETFTQDAQSMERSQGGLGLGLSIVRNLVEMHGGSVTAASEGRGRGSEFIVRLPLMERRPAAPAGAERGAPAAAGAAGRGEGVKILIVDDYVNAAQSLAALLELEGYETRVAYDGAEGLEAAADFKPALALVDIGLPTMNGFEVARRLRTTPGLERLGLVAVTGYGQQSDRRAAREAGFDEHVVKPLDPKGIGRLVERFAWAE